jgi:alpha-glucosidase (family GH31 glycosyl hydrolase)
MIGTSLLAAPIVYPKMHDRQVYFPKLKWYDLYTGKAYEKGNHTLANITLTAKVPLFLAEGKVIFMQNTVNVTKTKQLSNVFELVAGLHL